MSYNVPAITDVARKFRLHLKIYKTDEIKTNFQNSKVSGNVPKAGAIAELLWRVIGCIMPKSENRAMDGDQD
jgi:hypothetical protein